MQTLLDEITGTFAVLLGEEVTISARLGAPLTDTFYFQHDKGTVDILSVYSASYKTERMCFYLLHEEGMPPQLAVINIDLRFNNMRCGVGTAIIRSMVDAVLRNEWNTIIVVADSSNVIAAEGITVWEHIFNKFPWVTMETY